MSAGLSPRIVAVLKRPDKLDAIERMLMDLADQTRLADFSGAFRQKDVIAAATQLRIAAAPPIAAEGCDRSGKVASACWA